ncbi:tryptophan synthase subunit alpha [Conexibacter sp. JD483]|uniref:tryptophan synthase subunit alpha n=1 Tax=unclassified Conexibacter TaxID=2627773 RepID=UPI002716895F|nr:MULTISPECIES: tryptophan synthase subunit alpha [unclassified Conexibacter]MDO8184811.1 tryptophan synthase subunit alpha [Conexibacter sp. CPCC 205706]MDO8196586.1 tryptophan synthase subunit alpha [Conexibacter sp. CPCC 205762]MDR9368701.1 tryptophan synthase subunit alpha [Conexibacter sp. JD483]
MSTDTQTGVERIAAAFADSGKRAALMPYLMGGFPTLEASLAIGHAYADGGADLVELGVPFSDPLADGPVIHEAGTKALEAGATLASTLEVARELSQRLPVVLMTYANIVYGPGFEAFADKLVAHGVSGLIVPDLPLEEQPALLEVLDSRGLALVPLVAPTTPDERLARIGASARGFLYTVSVTGTTGERSGLSAGIGGVLTRAKEATPVPVAIGFGISTPEHARAAADAGAAGVIVGTRLVRAAAEADDPAAAVRELVAAMAEALR